MSTLISIDNDISKAQTMPSYFYQQQIFFDLTIKKIFNNSWQFIIDKKSLQNNKIFPFYFLKDSINEPLLISKNKEIKCFSNVCTHRANILCNHPSNKKTIKCNYHGRIFDLDGVFKFMPGFEGVKNFPTQNDNLKETKIKIWNDFIFCSINGKIKIDSAINKISNELQNYPFDRLTFDSDSSNEYVIDVHWAIYCENYLEGFHVPYVHKGLNDDIDLNLYETILFNNGVLQRAKDKNNNKKIYAHYFWIFPNLMFNFYEWGLSINVIEPINKNKTKIKFFSYPINGCKQPNKSNASLERVEREDQKIVSQVQKGLKSQFYSRGRYSVAHERGIHYFHQLLLKYIK